MIKCSVGHKRQGQALLRWYLSLVASDMLRCNVVFAYAKDILLVQR